MHKTTFSQQPYITEFFQKENREEYAKGNKTIIPIHTWLLYFFSFSHVKKKKQLLSESKMDKLFQWLQLVLSCHPTFGVQ